MSAQTGKQPPAFYKAATESSSRRGFLPSGYFQLIFNDFLMEKFEYNASLFHYIDLKSEFVKTELSPTMSGSGLYKL